jgi:hypothetical protein
MTLTTSYLARGAVALATSRSCRSLPRIWTSSTFTTMATVRSAAHASPAGKVPIPSDPPHNPTMDGVPSQWMTMASFSKSTKRHTKRLDCQSSTANFHTQHSIAVCPIIAVPVAVAPGSRIHGASRGSHLLSSVSVRRQHVPRHSRSQVSPMLSVIIGGGGLTRRLVAGGHVVKTAIMGSCDWTTPSTPSLLQN